MNNLQKQISADLKKAMLENNTEVKSILRVLIGELNREGKEVSDEKVVAICKKLIENANEVGNENEVNILNNYLPKQLSEDELKSLIVDNINANNYNSLKDMGKVMSYMKDNFSGKYDGKLVSTIVKEKLNI